MISKPWFKAKRYGYGWYPATWQAWCILGIYLLIIIQLIVIVNNYSEYTPERGIMITTQFVLLTIWLIITSYATGEKARWRWGN